MEVPATANITVVTDRKALTFYVTSFSDGHAPSCLHDVQKKKMHLIAPGHLLPPSHDPVLMLMCTL